eukprot:jgi/Mesvir1/19580/Mv09883-RA.1
MALRSFSCALCLSPFTLDDLCDAMTADSATPLVDEVHLALLRAVRHVFAAKDGHPESSTEQPSRAREGEPLPPEQLPIAVSPDGLQPAARSLHWSPARLHMLDAVTWPEFLWRYLVARGYEDDYGLAGGDMCSSDGRGCSGVAGKEEVSLSSQGVRTARRATVKLIQEMEYFRLPLRRRVSVLAFLCDDFLETRAAREHIALRTFAADVRDRIMRSTTGPKANNKGAPSSLQGGNKSTSSSLQGGEEGANGEQTKRNRRDARSQRGQRDAGGQRGRGDDEDEDCDDEFVDVEGVSSSEDEEEEEDEEAGEWGVGRWGSQGEASPAHCSQGDEDEDILEIEDGAEESEGAGGGKGRGSGGKKARRPSRAGSPPPLARLPALSSSKGPPGTKKANPAADGSFAASKKPLQLEAVGPHRMVDDEWLAAAVLLSAQDAENVARSNPEDNNIEMCLLCGMQGNLLCCDGCSASFHLRCAGVTRNAKSDNQWLCPECALGGPGSAWGRMGPVRAELLGSDAWGRVYWSAHDWLVISEDPCNWAPRWKPLQQDPSRWPKKSGRSVGSRVMSGAQTHGQSRTPTPCGGGSLLVGRGSLMAGDAHAASGVAQDRCNAGEDKDKALQLVQGGSGAVPSSGPLTQVFDIADAPSLVQYLKAANEMSRADRTSRMDRGGVGVVAVNGGREGSGRVRAAGGARGASVERPPKATRARDGSVGRSRDVSPALAMIAGKSSLGGPVKSSPGASGQGLKRAREVDEEEEIDIVGEDGPSPTFAGATVLGKNAGDGVDVMDASSNHEHENDDVTSPQWKHGRKAAQAAQVALAAPLGEDGMGKATGHISPGVNPAASPAGPQGCATAKVQAWERARWADHQRLVESLEALIARQRDKEGGKGRDGAVEEGTTQPADKGGMKAADGQKGQPVGDHNGERPDGATAAKAAGSDAAAQETAAPPMHRPGSAPGVGAEAGAGSAGVGATPGASTRGDGNPVVQWDVDVSEMVLGAAVRGGEGDAAVGNHQSDVPAISTAANDTAAKVALQGVGQEGRGVGVGPGPCGNGLAMAVEFQGHGRAEGEGHAGVLPQLGSRGTSLGAAAGEGAGVSTRGGRAVSASNGMGAQQAALDTMAGAAVSEGVLGGPQVEGACEASSHEDITAQVNAPLAASSGADGCAPDAVNAGTAHEDLAMAACARGQGTCARTGVSGPAGEPSSSAQHPAATNETETHDAGSSDNGREEAGRDDDVGGKGARLNASGQAAGGRSSKNMSVPPASKGGPDSHMKDALSDACVAGEPDMLSPMPPDAGVGLGIVPLVLPTTAASPTLPAGLSADGPARTGPDRDAAAGSCLQDGDVMDCDATGPGSAPILADGVAGLGMSRAHKVESGTPAPQGPLSALQAGEHGQQAAKGPASSSVMPSAVVDGNASAASMEPPKQESNEGDILAWLRGQGREQRRRQREASREQQRRPGQGNDGAAGSREMVMRGAVSARGGRATGSGVKGRGGRRAASDATEESFLKYRNQYKHGLLAAIAAVEAVRETESLPRDCFVLDPFSWYADAVRAEEPMAPRCGYCHTCAGTTRKLCMNPAADMARSSTALRVIKLAHAKVDAASSLKARASDQPDTSRLPLLALQLLALERACRPVLAGRWWAGIPPSHHKEAHNATPAPHHKDAPGLSSHTKDGHSIASSSHDRDQSHRKPGERVDAHPLAAPSSHKDAHVTPSPSSLKDAPSQGVAPSQGIAQGVAPSPISSMLALQEPLGRGGQVPSEGAAKGPEGKSLGEGGSGLGKKRWRQQWTNKVVDKASNVAALASALLHLEEALFRGCAIDKSWATAEDSQLSNVGAVASGTASSHNAGGGGGGSKSHKALARTVAKLAVPRELAGLPSLGGWFFLPCTCNKRGDMHWRRDTCQYGRQLIERSLAKAAARNGGLHTIPGVIYPPALPEFDEDTVKLAVRRTARAGWRARVESARTAAQLALELRTLDKNLQWVNIALAHTPVSNDAPPTTVGKSPLLKKGVAAITAAVAAVTPSPGKPSASATAVAPALGGGATGSGYACGSTGLFASPVDGPNAHLASELASSIGQKRVFPLSSSYVAPRCLSMTPEGATAGKCAAGGAWRGGATLALMLPLSAGAREEGWGHVACGVATGMMG